MGKVRVTLTDGRIVDGELTDRHRAFRGQPVLMVNGEPYSGMDAISEGFLVYPVNDPDVDRWIGTFRVSG